MDVIIILKLFDVFRSVHDFHVVYLCACACIWLEFWEFGEIRGVGVIAKWST